MSDGRFAGVGWVSEEHAVCVVDERGRIVRASATGMASWDSEHYARGCWVWGWRWSRSTARMGC
jgi:hypothetical protein